MSFCSFSSQSIINESVTVDNLFIHEFMPHAPEHCTKVYLYGLYLCTLPLSQDNSLESFAKQLNLTQTEVEGCFHYWKEQGLVQILDTVPFQVKYLPVNNVLSSIKKYKLDKYTSFNTQAQDLIKGRQITPTEYQVYYDLIERFHFEETALLMLISYCVNLKGTNIGHSYISTVAKNWANENITTSEKVEERLKEYELINTNLGELYKALGIKRTPYIEERDLYNKWTKQFGFEESVILKIAKNLKKKKLKADFLNLDKQIEKYKTMQFFDIKEIESFEANYEQLKETALCVLKNLGLYYENLEPVIETYISNWASLGYDQATLEKIAQFCFAKNNRTLSSMDHTIKKLFKLGVVSFESLEEYFGQLTNVDKEIKKILTNLGLTRNVNSSDRTFYSVWMENWKISGELLEYAISLSVSKVQPMVYLNKILSNFFENSIKTVEEAKALALKESQQKTTAKPQEFFKGRSYTSKDLNALFDQVDEIEV
ncbi:MAG: DnaD domain protein [Christensenellales bacterium]|jgi:DnaD/phage-associated family protein